MKLAEIASLLCIYRYHLFFLTFGVFGIIYGMQTGQSISLYVGIAYLVIFVLAVICCSIRPQRVPLDVHQVPAIVSSGTSMDSDETLTVYSVL